jgi:hypothetical protein
MTKKIFIRGSAATPAIELANAEFIVRMTGPQRGRGAAVTLHMIDGSEVQATFPLRADVFELDGLWFRSQASKVAAVQPVTVDEHQDEISAEFDRIFGRLTKAGGP